MKTKALYAGSFDPVTRGHLNIISRASKMYDELVVAVVTNPNKKSLLSLDERMELIRKLTSELSNVQIDAFEGLLADYVNANGFTAVVRGLRNSADFDYEIAMAQTNADLFTGGTETIFMMTDPEYSYISSSTVREVASLGGKIDGYVPEIVADVMYDKYRRK